MKIDMQKYLKRILTSTITIVLFLIISLLNNYYFLPEQDKNRMLSYLPATIIFSILFMAVFWYLIGIRENKD